MLVLAALGAVLALLCSPSAMAAPQAPAPGLPNPNDPVQGSNLPDKAKSFLTPIEKIFTAKPCKGLVQGVVPGGGTGGGVRCTNGDEGKKHYEFTGVGTIRGFWMTDAQYRIAHNPYSPWHSAEDQFFVRFFGRARGLPTMPFYGLGPGSSLSNQTFFSEGDVLAGVQIVDPLSKWMRIGGRFESLWPNVAGANPKSQSIETKFPLTPGLATQPNLLHYEVFINPHWKARPPFDLDYKLSYGYYQDHDTGQFSFRRFEGNFYNTFYPFHTENHGIKMRNTDNFFTIHELISFSDTSAGHAVPFYLQRTLGGTDVNNEPTLRSFKDYRFRGPEVLEFGAEYNQRFPKILYGLFGGFVFFDAGQVALRRSDLDLARMRESYGAGVSVWLRSNVLFRVYVGVGSGEGTHPYFGVPSFNGEDLIVGRGPVETPWN